MNVELKRIGLAVLGVALLTVTSLATLGASQQTSPGTQNDEFRVDPMRGPVDLGLTDPILIGAIDVHAHLDPDAPGAGGQVRGIDALDFAVLASERGMRGFVFKTHQDPMSAGIAYLTRKHVAPGLEVFGRMALNMSTGGIDYSVPAVEHFTQIKGGWARIVEMPTRDSENGTRTETPETMARNRPWILLMPPDTPRRFVRISRDGELLPEVKYLIGVMAKIRTVDSNGRLVLATGHSSPEEHLLLARAGRQAGLQVMLTHPGNIPQLPEVAKLGAYIEVNASGIYRTEKGAQLAAEMIRKIGAESLVMGTDCGQMGNPYPSDCLVLAARKLRALGITDRQLGLMMRDNPAKLLGLEPWPWGQSPAPTASAHRSQNRR